MIDHGLKRRKLLDIAWRYALALAASAVAIALRFWLTPFLGDRNFYHTAWAALAISAWYYGLGPSILNAFASVLGVWYFFLRSDQGGLALDRMQVSGMIGFLVFSAVIIAFGESSRRLKARKERVEEILRESEAQLRLANQEMQAQIERRTLQLQQKTIQTMEQARLIDLANDAIFVRSSRDRIAFWNQGAERLYGWSKQEALGRLTHELLHTVFPVPFSEVAKTERWQGELIQNKRDGSKITVASRWTVLRNDDGEFTGWLEINTDITAQKRAEEAARALSGRILSLQDDERRRIARELHDSLGQYLVSLKVNLDLLSNALTDQKQAVLLLECLAAVDQSLAETRTISHLLHPPLLDEAGFASAARWYVDGFAHRSALEVELEFPAEVPRLDRDVETALFRVLQEALTNVHRHSGGTGVQIRLQFDDGQVQLRITDNGHGIPAERLRILQKDDSAAGVGLAGMRQRMRELGGSLEIEAAFPGTMILATIPLRGDARVPSSTPDEESDDRSASAA